jgi:hypothetical protein
MADYTDDFNRAAVGANWTDISPTSSGWYMVASTSIYSHAYTQSNCLAWTANSLTQSQYSQVLLPALTVAYNGAGPCVRCSNAADTWYGFKCRTNNCLLVKCVAGTISTIATYATGTSSGHTARLEVTGTADLVCKIDGSTVLTYTDSSSPLSGSYVGINHEGGNSDEVRMDDWAGGDIGGAAASAVPVFMATYRRKM